MKKLFIICFLLTATFSINAQDLTLEETENYINDIFKTNMVHYFSGEDNNGYSILGVKIQRTGKVTFYNQFHQDQKTNEFNNPIGSFSVFDLDEKKTVYYSSLYLIDNKGKSIGHFSTKLSQSEGNRLLKALFYLKTICDKSLDPFGH
ncbi:MAG: hypothetical protein WC389_11355 [Lutibacter sp.]|jgi:hypothetical protein